MEPAANHQIEPCPHDMCEGDCAGDCVSSLWRGPQPQRSEPLTDDQMEDAANSGPLGSCYSCTQEGVGIQRDGNHVAVVCLDHYNPDAPIFGDYPPVAVQLALRDSGK